MQDAITDIKSNDWQSSFEVQIYREINIFHQIQDFVEKREDNQEHNGGDKNEEGNVEFQI